MLWGAVPAIEKEIILTGELGTRFLMYFYDPPPSKYAMDMMLTRSGKKSIEQFKLETGELEASLCRNVERDRARASNEKWAWIIFDEAGLEIFARNFMDDINKVMSYVMQSFRHTKINLVVNCPHPRALKKKQTVTLVEQRVWIRSSFYYVMTHCHIGTSMDNRERDVKSIRELEDKAREAAKAKDLDRYVSFYADDAVLLWPGAPMVTGRAAIREFMRVFLSMPDFSLSFETAKVDVSRAGDFAYTCGTNKVTLVDPNGKKMKDSGKYLTVYRKQPDGTWKVVADLGNSDLPAPVPA